MQAGSSDAAAGTDRKISSRRRTAKGRIEKRASTRSGIADMHQRFDPQPGKTGCGEQRAQVPLLLDATFWPCMPAGEQAVSRVTWNLFPFLPA